MNILHELKEDVHDMGILDKIFNFVNSLLQKLATKLADKWKEFKTQQLFEPSKPNKFGYYFKSLSQR